MFSLTFVHNAAILDKKKDLDYPRKKKERKHFRLLQWLFESKFLVRANWLAIYLIIIDQCKCNSCIVFRVLYVDTYRQREIEWLKQNVKSITDITILFFSMEIEQN